MISQISKFSPSLCSSSGVYPLTVHYNWTGRRFSTQPSSLITLTRLTNVFLPCFLQIMCCLSSATLPPAKLSAQVCSHRHVWKQAVSARMVNSKWSKWWQDGHFLLQTRGGWSVTCFCCYPQWVHSVFEVGKMSNSSERSLLCPQWGLKYEVSETQTQSVLWDHLTTTLRQSSPIRPAYGKAHS